MLTQCENCGFYVRKGDEFCLNCGIKFENQEILRIKERAVTISAIISPVIAFIFTAFFLYLGQTGLFFVSFIILFWAFYYAFYQAVLNYYQKGKKTKLFSNLIDKDEIIQKRISELGKRTQQIDFVLDRIKETDGKNLQEVRQKLLSAREIVISQFARYELQKQKIELVRLQNGVSPYLFRLHRLNEFDTENGIVTAENTKFEINKIRQNLIRYDAMDFPGKALSEKQTFLTQLEETEDSCQKLREALLSRQAVHALHNISPIEENLKLPNTKELAHAADVFNIQTTLTDFSESFEELEHEYKRLKAEEEIGQKLLES